jgi:hypothetical protein
MGALKARIEQGALVQRYTEARAVLRAMLSEPEPSHADAIRRLKAVEGEQRGIIAKFPGWEPESLKTQPFMVPFATMTTWADELAGVIRLLEEGVKRV